MKKTLFSITLITCSVFAHAQQNEIATEISRLEQACVQAILPQDTATLKKLWALDFMVNAPSNRVVIGGQVKMVTSGVIKYSSFVLENEQTMVKGDFVITMGRETVVTLGSNYPTAGLTVHRRYTQVWQKQNGNWICIARQASNICEENKP